MADQIAKFRPDIVGVSAMTIEMSRALKIAKLSKEICDAKVVFGGPHPTVLPVETLSNENVDVVVVGEGEHTMLDIVKSEQGLIKMSDVKGIFYKQRQLKIKKNPSRERVDLDDLPFPDRDIFQISEILKNPCTNFPLPSPSLHVIASRGCIFNCAFCQPCLDNIFGRLRYRSIENLFDEIEFLIEKYRIKGLMIEDDTFTVNKRYASDFCNEIKRRDIDLSWYCHSRADTMNEDLLRKMREAGCISLCVGIESGSQRVLDILEKGTTEKQCEDVVKLCKKVGIVCIVNMMIGTLERE